MPADPAKKQTNDLNGRYFLGKIAAALMLYLGASPLFLMAGAYFLPGAFHLSFVLPAAAIVVTFLAGLFSGWRRKACFWLALAMVAGLNAAVLLPHGSLAMLLLLPCLLMMLLFMPALARPLHWEWPGPLLASGGGMHIAAQALSGNPAFAQASAVLPFLFSAYLLACLFLLNRRAVSEGTQGAPPAGLLTRHRRLLALLALVAVPAASWQAVKDAVQTLLAFLRDAAGAFFALLSFLLPEVTPVESGGAGQGFDLSMLGEAPPEPSLFAKIMEKALTVLGILLAAALIAFGLYQLARVLKKGFKALLARLRVYSQKIGEGYVDRTESLFRWSDVGQAARDRWALYQKRRARAPAWELLSARDKVRRVYALLLGRLKQENPAMTAREALLGGRLSVPPGEAGAMASLYEAARYSDHEISPKDAEAMRKSVGV